jgi:hypothetical protein
MVTSLQWLRPDRKPTLTRIRSQHISLVRKPPPR